MPADAPETNCIMISAIICQLWLYGIYVMRCCWVLALYWEDLVQFVVGCPTPTLRMFRVICMICVIKKPDDMVSCHVAHFGYPFGSLTDTQDKKIFVVIWTIYIYIYTYMYIYICKVVWWHLKQIFGGWLCDCLFCCRDINKHGGLLGVLIFLATNTPQWGRGHSILLMISDVSATWCGDLIWFMT